MCLHGFRVSGAVFRVEWAGVAQLVEHLICNQRVGGSNPFASSTDGNRKWSLKRQKVLPASIFGVGPVLRGDPTEVQAADGRSASGRG